MNKYVLFDKKQPSLELRKASAQGNVKKIEIILKENKNNSNFNINGQSSNGNTALLWSAKHKKGEYQKVTKLLLEHGANDLITNNLNETIYSFDCKTPVNTERPIFCAILREYKKSFGANQTNSTQLKLLTTLSHTFFTVLNNVNLRQYFPKHTKKIKILSLACGTSAEIIALDKYFKSNKIDFEFVGIDIDKSLLKQLSKIFANNKNIKLITADASSPKILAKYLQNNYFDFGILRNGDFTSESRADMFKSMIDQCFPKFLKDDAPLMTTFYNAIELNTCAKMTKLLTYYKKAFPKNSVLYKLTYAVKIDNCPYHVTPDQCSVILTFDKNAFENKHTYSSNQFRK